MKRPPLNAVPLPGMPLPRGEVFITMSPGQWDGMLAGAYECGATLLEVEEVRGEEKIVRAYQKKQEEESP